MQKSGGIFLIFGVQRVLCLSLTLFQYTQHDANKCEREKIKVLTMHACIVILHHNVCKTWST